ncbi:MAG TPA: 2Fe-2S iron-sulfur cluster-binding protein, partial [Paracoccaceae bacterium]|nr:2Fe-2S iron-sulfur cluster-binding protein [Paracoccaceae bacterium]
MADGSAGTGGDKDPLIIFTPSGIRGKVPAGTPVLTAARQLGVDLDSVCGGRGICSRCQVTPGYGEFAKHGIHVGEDALSEWNAVEERYKSKRGMIEGRRLGCQAKVMHDVLIDVPPESQVHKQLVRKRVEAREIVMDPATRLYYVEVAEPDMENPKGDLERLLDALWEQWELANVIGDLRTLQMLQPALREGEWKVTCAVYVGRGQAEGRIVQVWPGFHEGHVYGISVDIGSTTMSCHMSDLVTGEVVASAGIMNPQIRFGEDLMSRVSYSMMNPGGAADMTRAVREALNALIGQVAAEAQIDRSEIVEAVLVGNPVMHHLILGIDPVELGWAPFALATADSLTLWATEIELSMHPDARIYI